MSKILTRGNFYSDVVIRESKPDIRYCRDLVSVTVETGMDIGALLLADGTWAAKADAANVVQILVDPRIADAATGAATLAALVRGEAVVGTKYLAFSDGVMTDTESADVEGALKALGILTSKQS